MFIREHSLEEHYLRRRLELLEYLDSFARDEFYNTDPEDRMSEDDLRLRSEEHTSELQSH